MAWTEERVARLRKLWAEGNSASRIAKQLGGVSRNAVIGKVHRLGLNGRQKKYGLQTSVIDNRIEGAALKRKQIAAAKALAKAKQPVKPPRLSLDGALIASMPPIDPTLTIATIDENRCRYINGDPLADGTLCGRTTTGGAWCIMHHRLVYEPAKQKAKVRKASDTRGGWLRQLEREAPL